MPRTIRPHEEVSPAMSNTEGYVLPKPGVPKTLGILNIIFGVLGVLIGICTVGGLLLAPVIVEFGQRTIKEAQAKVETQEKSRLKEIDDRLAAAKTDEEKKAIEQEKAAAEANKVVINPVDMSVATAIMKDPTIMGVNYAQMLTSLGLSIAALVAGIGLVRLRAWGRSLALWEAGLRIAQLLAFIVINVVFVLPISQAANQKQIAQMEAAAKAPGAGQAEANALQLTKTMGGLALPLTIAQSLPWVIYPIILLVLLNGQGAKAACRPKKLASADDF